MRQKHRLNVAKILKQADESATNYDFDTGTMLIDDAITTINSTSRSDDYAQKYYYINFIHCFIEYVINPCFIRLVGELRSARATLSSGGNYQLGGHAQLQAQRMYYY